MEHQVLAHQPAGIGQAIGEAPGGGVQQQPRRADAVAGEDDDFRRLELLDAVGVVIDHARRHAVLAGDDLAHAAVGAQLDAGADGMRPIGDVGARLRSLGAGRRAVAEIDAGRAAIVFGGGDRAVGRPPVPAELVHRLRDLRAGLAQRQRRHRRLVRRIGGIAGEPGDAGHAVVLGEERLQRRIIDRPVIGHAIQRADAEVGGVQARIMRRVHHGRAADGVEVHHLDRRVVVVDRIVARPLADVRTGGVVAEHARLVVPPVGRIVGLLHPVALLQAEDPHPRLGEAPGDRGAGGAGADDEHVDLVVHAVAPQLARDEELLVDAVLQPPVAQERAAVREEKARLSRMLSGV